MQGATIEQLTREAQAMQAENARLTTRVEDLEVELQEEKEARRHAEQESADNQEEANQARASQDVLADTLAGVANAMRRG